MLISLVADCTLLSIILPSTATPLTPPLFAKNHTAIMKWVSCIVQTPTSNGSWLTFSCSLFEVTTLGQPLEVRAVPISNLST